MVCPNGRPALTRVASRPRPLRHRRSVADDQPEERICRSAIEPPHGRDGRETSPRSTGIARRDGSGPQSHAAPSHQRDADGRRTGARAARRIHDVQVDVPIQEPSRMRRSRDRRRTRGPRSDTSLENAREATRPPPFRDQEETVTAGITPPLKTGRMTGCIAKRETAGSSAGEPIERMTSTIGVAGRRSRRPWDRTDGGHPERRWKRDGPELDQIEMIEHETRSSPPRACLRRGAWASTRSASPVNGAAHMRPAIHSVGYALLDD